MAHTLARFSELPEELLDHVILLSADYGPDRRSPRRRRQLSRLSLVCRAWRKIAQRALVEPERPVQLFHAKQFRPLVALLQSPQQAVGDLVTHLDLELWGEVQDRQLAQTVTACQHLQVLTLTHIERVRLDEIAIGPGLSSLSLRQCTLVSAYYPDPPPEDDPAQSWIPQSLRLPSAFSTLSRLDLRLCSLRRDFLPLDLLERDNESLLPQLRHLLLFTGSHDQSPATVRALVRSVAPRLRSLSLDYTAWEILLPAFDADSLEQPLELPSLKTYGTYWDAAYHTLVGLPLALPALAAAAATPSVHRALSRPKPNQSVPFIHTALYPAQLDSLAATLQSVLTNPELRAAGAWAQVERWQVEGTLRDLDELERERERDRAREAADWGEEEVGVGEDEGSDAAEDEEEEVFLAEADSADEEIAAEDAARRPRPHNRRRPRRAGLRAPSNRIAALEQLARSEAGIDLRVEPSAASEGSRAGESNQDGQPEQPAVQRATFERGFGTSWWRFVDEVERNEA